MAQLAEGCWFKFALVNISLFNSKSFKICPVGFPHGLLLNYIQTHFFNFYRVSI